MFLTVATSRLKENCKNVYFSNDGKNNQPTMRLLPSSIDDYSERLGGLGRTNARWVFVKLQRLCQSCCGSCLIFDFGVDGGNTEDSNRETFPPAGTQCAQCPGSTSLHSVLRTHNNPVTLPRRHVIFPQQPRSFKSFGLSNKHRN